MIRLSFATLALLLALAAGCVHHRNDTARSEYQRTETTRSQEGNAAGAELKPGESRQSETIRTHEETTTTRRSK